MKKTSEEGQGRTGLEKQVAANKKFPCERKTYSVPLVQWKIILTTAVSYSQLLGFYVTFYI